QAAVDLLAVLVVAALVEAVLVLRVGERRVHHHAAARQCDVVEPVAQAVAERDADRGALALEAFGRGPDPPFDLAACGHHRGARPDRTAATARRRSRRSTSG